MSFSFSPFTKVPVMYALGTGFWALVSLSFAQTPAVPWPSLAAGAGLVFFFFFLPCAFVKLFLCFGVKPILLFRFELSEMGKATRFPSLCLCFKPLGKAWLSPKPLGKAWLLLAASFCLLHLGSEPRHLGKPSESKETN